MVTSGAHCLLSSQQLISVKPTPNTEEGRSRRTVLCRRAQVWELSAPRRDGACIVQLWNSSPALPLQRFSLPHKNSFSLSFPAPHYPVYSVCSVLRFFTGLSGVTTAKAPAEMGVNRGKIFFCFISQDMAVLFDGGYCDRQPRFQLLIFHFFSDTLL